jgi:hypothetical protein
MKTFEQHKEEIRVRVQELLSLRARKQGLLDYIEEVTEEAHKGITRLEAEKKKLEDRIALLQAGIKESEPAAFDELSDLTASETRVESQIKALGHSLPVEFLRKSIALDVGSLRVTVSKASTHREFRVPEMLAAYPELTELEVDGDALIEPSLNEGVFDRLVASGLLTEKDFTKFITEVKDKAPSVSIKTVDRDQ